MSLLTLKEACKYLQKRNFKYKDKTIMDRTVRTMWDNGWFESKNICQCGRSKMVLKDELDIIIQEFREETNDEIHEFD